MCGRYKLFVFVQNLNRVIDLEEVEATKAEKKLQGYIATIEKHTQVREEKEKARRKTVQEYVVAGS